MTGPLAQQFAGLRGALEPRLLCNDAACPSCNRARSYLAALSSIERHVQLLEQKEGQPIQNAARALLSATDDAQRNAALGDLYNALALCFPEIPGQDDE